MGEQVEAQVLRGASADGGDELKGSLWPTIDAGERGRRRGRKKGDDR
jgi:hypothetical protein